MIALNSTISDWTADQNVCSVLNHNMVVFNAQLPKILWIIVGMTFVMFLFYTYLLWKHVELKKEILILRKNWESKEEPPHDKQ